jgi:hypothetical protein
MPSRTNLIAIAAVVMMSVLTPTSAFASADPGGGGSAGHQPTSNADRAVAAFDALQANFGTTDGSGLYREQFPVAAGDNAYSYEWPFSQAHAATADLANLRGSTGNRFDEALAKADAAQEHYWKADGGTTQLPGYASYPVGEYGGGGDFFYDDNEWVGLLDVQRYLTDHDTAALAKAKQIFDLVLSGWDTDATHASPGGTFWTQASWSTDRNTVSNMPAAELGVRLYQITGTRSYLDQALKMYHWTNDNLQRPDGLYSDHLDLAGTIEPTVWSYNQGVPVGVNVLLFEVTHDRAYLTEAQRIASAATQYFDAQGGIKTQPVAFNSIYFKNLMLLESVTGGSTYRTAMQSYADDLWTNNRDATTGLFHFGSDHSQVIDQAAAVQLYAVLGWNASQLRTLY